MSKSGKRVKFELFRFYPAEGWHDAGWGKVAESSTREGLDDAIKSHKRGRLRIETTTFEWEEVER